MIVLLLAGSACSPRAAAAGIFNRERPDEFAVQRQAPLVVPPDFSLVPPAPGAPRPAEGTASQQALDAMFGGSAPRSSVETSALDRAGTADPSIRSVVGDRADQHGRQGLRHPRDRRRAAGRRARGTGG